MLGRALAGAVQNLRHCARAATASPKTRSAPPAPIQARSSLLCIVETPADQNMIESSHGYRGLYYVLMGRVAPLEGIGPRELDFDRVIRRATDGVVQEVILATNFTAEGETTAHFLGEAPSAGRAGWLRQPRRAPRGSERLNWPRSWLRQRSDAEGKRVALRGGLARSWLRQSAATPLRKRVALRGRLTMSALTGAESLELGTLIAGPFAARIFGEFGADVIKVETPHGPDGSGGGDPIRSWRHLHQGNSLWWSVQRATSAHRAQPRDPRARDIARQLALEADVVVENYRPGVLEKWGLLRAAARAESRDHHGAPVRLRADRADEGPAGLRRHRRIHGRPALCVGPSDRPPLRVGISIGDSIAALHGVIGAMMALRHRDATGGRWNGLAGEARRAGRARWWTWRCTRPCST